MKKNRLALLALAAALGGVAGCGPSTPSDSLDAVVPLETQQKVYNELRQAMRKAGAESLKRFPQTGLAGGGAEEFRVVQDSLQKAYWADVLDSNAVAPNYGDSIWTKGTALKWKVDTKRDRKKAAGKKK